MTTLSLRSIAERCLGVSGDLSVNNDVYGYIFREADGSVFGVLDSSGSDRLPLSGEPTTRSLKRHLEALSGQAVDLVLFLVGHEDDFSGAFNRDELTKIQYAIQITRDLYVQAGLGVRRLNWRRIPLADAGGYVNIADRAEAENLTDDFSGPESGIDVFFVQSIGVAAGWSNILGPCDKNFFWGLTGAVLEVSGRRRFLGIVLGHELGHYLTLPHADTITNMMGEDPDGDGIGRVSDNSTTITREQADKMRLHCSVSGPC